MRRGLGAPRATSRTLQIKGWPYCCVTLGEKNKVPVRRHTSRRLGPLLVWGTSFPVPWGGSIPCSGRSLMGKVCLPVARKQGAGPVGSQPGAQADGDKIK